MTNTADRGRIVAVLGPTNTGKTHFALERMLGHASGMIGFPLRLLARENYDRIVRLKGAGTVALITGEERIVPPHPRWLVCTVEAMPVERRVACLVVDEIQLCADPERGHVFTDRLLHARGDQETLFLGADTIRPLLRRLVPGAEIVSRPRLSKLIHAGPRKLDRLPPRSVVVAFSAAEVYALAESVRRARGGAAVVLGALSPRTRNAQIALYQAGEVDHIVATDAIGMGLNMDVDHVAFAALRKFDGRAPRPLAASELAQIAGRAGRHLNDGTFGTTADAGALPSELVEAIESHRFDPLRSLMWRNRDLRFTSPRALLASLDRPPDRAGLTRTREADDQRALTALAADPGIEALATSPARVRLLWEVCQIPDFRKVMDESHVRLLKWVFVHLAGPNHRLPEDGLATAIERLDRVEGEIDTLVARIAAIRTWTFISHRGEWVADPAHWQELTRAIEDRLSDALHQRLTNRFIDRRTAVLLRRLREPERMRAELAPSGAVMVEGHLIGQLDGFTFAPAPAETGGAARVVSAAAGRALRDEIAARVARLLAAEPAAFQLGAEGIVWEGAMVATLRPGTDPFKPLAEPVNSDLLAPTERDRLRRALTQAARTRIAEAFAPLLRAVDADLSGAARGLVHHLVEGGGSAPRSAARLMLAALQPADYQALTRLGVRLGRMTLFLPALLKPSAQAARALLWSLAAGRPAPALPGARTALEITADADFYPAIGYPVRGGIAVRADILERVVASANRAGRAGPFVPGPDLFGPLGLGPEPVRRLLGGVGFVAAEGPPGALRPRR